MRASGLTIDKETEMVAPREESALEKHGLSILALIIVALLTWVGVTLNELQKNSATTATEMSYIKNDIQNIKQQNRSIYTKAEAQAAWGEYRKDMRAIEERIRSLEIGGK